MSAWLSIALFIGYPPLIVYLLSLILYNTELYKFSNKGLIENAFTTFFIVPQYLMCLAFLVFHLFVTVCPRVWSIVLLNIFSSVFSILAGGSLFLIRMMTSYHFNNDRSRMLFIGFTLLTLVQLLGYSWWPFYAQKTVQNQRRWRSPQSFCNTSCVMHVLFSIFAVIGFLCFILYSASVVSNGIVIKFSYKSILPITYQQYVFDSTVLQLPIILYPTMLTLQMLFVNYKKIWLAQIICLVKSLLDFFLGYAIFMLFWYLFRYFIYTALHHGDFDTDRTIFKSIILLLCTSIPLSLSSVSMCLPWSYIFWSHLTFWKETLIFFDEESQPLIHSTGDY